MDFLHVPSIFWVTLLSVTAILISATIIGRAWAEFFPYRLRSAARFYLAPVLGLATLTIIASWLGRIMPLGNSVLVPVLVLALITWSLVRDASVRQAFRHGLLISIFGIVCGASVLVPLFNSGAFNAHNDGFTYLVHANWLQGNAFGDPILPNQITPLTTQVALYQQEGFRMGASYLFALTQSLLNLQWSYEVYPAVVISGIATCCMAAGFPLVQSLLPFRRRTRLALLALPAFSVGGLVFGANLGFLPQTVGLSMGAGLLFSVGPSLRWVSISSTSGWRIAKVALPAAVLFSAAVFAYSELMPFLLLALLGSGLLLPFRFRAWSECLLYTGVVLGLAAILLNLELFRAYSALQTQTGAVVGSPVDWSLLGYISHAFGVHGGAWDRFQWTLPESSGAALFFMGLAMTVLYGLIILSGSRAIAVKIKCGELLPAALILLIFLAGLLYFRYFVPSPFPKGLGQSWSQFKLADWSHPFTMVFSLLALAQLLRRMQKYLAYVTTLLFVASFAGATLISVARVSPLIDYYGGTQDLNGFYQEFRHEVTTTCPRNVSVYLSLKDQHQKFRQMAVYLLADREVTSDWTDDGYIFPFLINERRTQLLNPGDCVVEPAYEKALVSEGKIVGPVRIGIFDGEGHIRTVATAGAYDRESDSSNWWHWIERKAIFQLQPLYVPKEASQVSLRFEYATRGEQTLSIQLRIRDGSSWQTTLFSEGDAPAIFEEIIDISPSELAELSIETDGRASRLGEQDDRMAAWIIRNLKVTPILQE